jgi:hypothetical protein
LQDTLQYLEQRDPAAYAKLRALVPAASWSAVVDAKQTAWVPVEHELEFVDRWVPVLGEQGTVDVVSEAVLGTLRSPLFSSIARGAVRLLGMNPSSLIKMVPRAWGNVYRDHLTAVIEELDEQHAVLRFEDIAPKVHATLGYRTVWKGVLFAAFSFCEHEGDALWLPDVGQRSGTWELQWRPKPTAAGSGS